jgi:hypothetical protein
MQRHRLAQAIDQFVQRATLADDGNLEALSYVPATTAADHRMNGFSRRRVPVCCVASSGLGNRAPGWFKPLMTIRAADFVHPSRHALEVIQAVCMVCRRIDAASTHDVGEHGARVEMREGQNDVARSKPPAATPATDPESSAEDLFMDCHTFNIHL